MKPFEFPLEQALRWRGEQAGLQKLRLAAAVGLAARTHAAIAGQKAEAAQAASTIAAGGLGERDGALLSAYAAFDSRTKIKISELGKRAREADAALAAEVSGLIEANRKVRVLEKMRHKKWTRWTRECDRETETFATEAFLHKLQSGKRP